MSYPIICRRYQIQQYAKKPIGDILRITGYRTLFTNYTILSGPEMMN